MFGIKSATPISSEYKKGGEFAAIYLTKALQCLYTINASDPRPEKGNETANIDCSLSKYAQTSRLRAAVKTHLRERLPCPRIEKLSIFRLENKSKNSFIPLK